MEPAGPDLNLATLHRTPYGWPLRQLGIPRAHEVTRGSPGCVVAVIDLGYNPHPHHAAHLWVNPNPRRGDVHGWDCADDDASLEPTGPGADTPYYRDHHCFIVGEVIACAPECPVMIVRTGYRSTADSWCRAIDYAVDHGARVLVMPHGFLTHGKNPDRPPLFYRGTDFSYPLDNPGLRRSVEAAWDAGCLLCHGAADNRGRRVAYANAALEGAMAVGSASRKGGPANIRADSDYVEVAAPGGDRGTGEELDRVWSTGGNGAYVASEGGCMAAGFAGGVAALVWSQFPSLTNAQLRQVLRNTAGNEQWDSKLGWGLLNASRAVRLRPEQLGQDLRVQVKSCRLESKRNQHTLHVPLENRGALDVSRALVVIFNGDPRRPAAPRATWEHPVILQTRQLGHALVPVRGLHGATATVALEEVTEEIWVQACVLDHRGNDAAVTRRVQ